jgi:histone-lysine N-methyltransferase SETD2
MEKFKGKLSRDDLKRFAKEVRLLMWTCGACVTNDRSQQISKKLVSSDYKNHRVEDPTRISSRQEKQVKKYVQDYFEKAVAKKKEHDKKKGERKVKEAMSGGPAVSELAAEVKKEEENHSDGEQDVAMSDDEDVKPKQETATPITPLDQLLNAEGLKRKRGEDDDPDSIKKEDKNATPIKRLRSETPPPPPPPPPANGMHLDPSTPSNDIVDNGISPNDLGEDTSTDESSTNFANGPPPPPPPPRATDAHYEDMDISGHAPTPETLNMTSPDNEDNEHDSHLPEHRRRQVPELQVQGGA